MVLEELREYDVFGQFGRRRLINLVLAEDQLYPRSTRRGPAMTDGADGFSLYTQCSDSVQTHNDQGVQTLNR